MKKILLTLLLAGIGLGLNAAVKNGEIAPGFTLQDMHGKSVSLSDFKGKTVVLEWMNPGCPFVRKFYTEHHMHAFQKEAADHGVVWIAINSTIPTHNDYLTPEASVKWAKDHKFKGIWLLDPDGKAGKAYGATRTPEMFIINPQGVVVYQGAIDSVRDARPSSIAGAENYVMNALRELADGKPVSTAQTVPYGCTIKY